MALPGRVKSYPRSVTPNAHEARVRWLAGTFLVAPVLVAAWLLLPHGDVRSAAGVGAMAGAALVLGIMLVWVPAGRIPDFVLKASLFAATTVISGGVVFGGESGAIFALFYFWSVPYAFAYFTPRDGVHHTIWVGLCYAIVLLIQRHNGISSGDHLLSNWLLLIGSLAVVGTLVREITQWGRDSDARFRRGFDDSPAPMAVVALDGTAIEVNDALCRLLGHTPAEIEGQLFGQGLVHTEDLARGRVAFARIAAPGGEFATFDLRLLSKAGGVVLTSVTASVVRDAQQNAQYYFVQAQDVTAERGSVAELRRRGLQQQAIARLGQLALVERELGPFMQHLTATITETLGIQRATVLELDGAEFLVVAGVGWPDGIVGTVRTPSDGRTPAALALSSKTPVVIDDVLADPRFEVPQIVHSFGIRSGIAAVVDGQAGAFGVLVVYAAELRSFDADDVAFVQAAANVLASAVDRRRSDDANRYAALHDPLTGLGNRTLALDRLQHALARRQREATNVAVLVLDLDRFKVINDSLGHDAGDELLLQLAPRLCEAVRPTDTVARLGGDEFIVVCEDVAGPSDAKHVAERVAAAVARPLLLQSGEHFLTASIGLAISGTDADTPETLLRDADAAMYRAKDGGRGRHELFDDGMREQALLRMQTESELRRAIDGRELRVHYQPIVDVVSGRTVGVEALARWQHPERGLLGPGEFIAVAEEVGLISRLGSWVLTEASNQVAAWQRTFGPLELCVNVSGRQLASPGFADEVAMIAQESGIMAGTLGLEITESVLIEDATAPVAVLSDLHDRGLRLLLDDFGTGYSSLSYVKNFPLDSLKLDRSFIAGLGQHAEDTAIVQAVISMARAVGMGVVAEGVETPAQVARLLSLGCERAQGYLFARPMPAEDLERFLAEPVRAAVA